MTNARVFVTMEQLEAARKILAFLNDTGEITAGGTDHPGDICLLTTNESYRIEPHGKHSPL